MIDSNGSGTRRWSTQSQLLMIISEAHDYPTRIMDMDIHFHPRPSILLSMDNTGLLHLWEVTTTTATTSEEVPLEHLGSIQLPSTSSNYPRSLQLNSYHNENHSYEMIVGYSEHSLSVVRFSLSATTSSSSSPIDNVAVDEFLPVSHSGRIKKIAVNLKLPGLVATAGGDRTVRLWQVAGDPREVAVISLECTPSAVAFNPVGEFLVVGSDSGVLLFLGSAEFQAWVRSRTGRTSRTELEEIPAMQWSLYDVKTIGGGEKYY